MIPVGNVNPAATEKMTADPAGMLDEVLIVLPLTAAVKLMVPTGVSGPFHS